MVGFLSIDTTWLIDLQRERLREAKGAAWSVLEQHPEARLACSVVAWGEFLEGMSGREKVVSFVRAHLDVLPVTEPVSVRYAEVVRELRSAGTLIGTNDLWIAVHALVLEQPLVTRNHREFERVPGLRVIGY